ncbi:MAG TPA: BTAD domain-containing putative transcriptional regulator [Aquihabitans sp.]|nr:BTAD domain-containing putative transcriptional regulator [Aquihabitans sp.]
MTAPLVVSILGPVEARRDGVALPLGGRRQRSVLTRLALAAGAPVPIDRIIDDLWGGEPPASATNTLQSYVSNLRKALGGDVPAIAREGDAYRLAVGPEAFAAERAEALVAEGDGTDDPEARLRAFAAARSLWHGRSLAEVDDEPWAQGDAVRLEALRLRADEGRIDALLDLDRAGEAVSELEALVAAHPLHERFAEQLVLALYRSGRQAEALRAYERARATYAAELGTAPGPELRRLADAVLDQDPSLGASSPAAPAVRGHATSDGSPLPLPPAVAERRTRSAFVGRSAERAALRAAWDAALAGERRLLVLAGEPGAGKTRLAQELARELHAEGAYVLWGRCSVDHLIAYQPVVEALRTALRSLPADRVAELVAPRPPLGLLLPELAGDAELPARTERFELYESLADLLGEVTIATPMLLVIDDLQWADPSTLTLLEQVLSTPRGGRSLIVATMRRPAGRPTADVDRFLAEVRRAQRFDAVEVGGLGRGDVAALLAERGAEADDEAVDLVVERTAGNPFFVEALADAGATVDARDLPSSVREVLDQRLAALDPDAAAVLSAAAVIGQRADITLLATVTDLDQGAVLDLVDDAIAKGVLAEDEEIGWVTFPHQLVRQALIARTSRNREARLHVRIADALESGAASKDAVLTAAQHLVAAGRACPPARAATAAVAAGRRALEVVADAEAERWARRALEVLEGAADGPDERRARADAALLAAEAARLRGDLEAARRALSGVTARARAEGDGRTLARAAQQWALVSGAIGFSFSGLDDDLIALIAEALELVGPDDHAERATLLAWSSLALNPGDDRDGQDHLSIAAIEEAALVPGDAHVQALALFARHMAVGGPAGLDERRALLAPLRRAARGWSEMEVIARALAVIDALEGGDVADARAATEDLRSFVAPFGRPALDAFVAFFDAMWAILAGDLARAAELSDAALAIGVEAHGDNAATAWAGQQLVVALGQGRIGELVDDVARLVDEQPLVPVWGMVLARALVGRGEEVEARAVAHRYLVDGGLSVHPRSVLRYLVAAMAAEVCWLTSDEVLAEHLVVELAPISHRVAVTGLAASCAGHLVRHHGLVLAVGGDLDGAADLLELAASTAAADGFGWAEAQSLADRAVVLRRRGGLGDAEDAAADDERAERLAAALGLELVRPAPSAS